MDNVRSRTDSHGRQCANHSQWRVLPGKSPERLSPYYQLPCDFGTSLIAVWGSEEATEPVYLCEGHVKQFLSSVASRASGASVARRKEKGEEAKAGAAAESRQAPSAPPEAGKNFREAPRKPAARTQTIAERCVALDRQIGELTAQMEDILSQSEATIDAAATIDGPLEQAILEIIGNPELSETRKDAAIAHLGELQRSLKQESGQNLTLLEAHRIRQSLAGCLSGNFGAPEEARPGYRAVLESVEKAIQAALAESETQPVSA